MHDIAKVKKVGLIDEACSIYKTKANIKTPIWQKPDMMDYFLKELKLNSKLSINLENLVGKLK